MKKSLRIFRGHYLAHCLDTTQLYPGLDRLFDGRGTRMKALATNKSLEYTLHIIEGLKVKEQFAAIEGPLDQSDLKPDPGMLWRILERLCGSTGSSRARGRQYERRASRPNCRGVRLRGRLRVRQSRQSIRPQPRLLL